MDVPMPASPADQETGANVAGGKSNEAVRAADGSTTPRTAFLAGFLVTGSAGNDPRSSSRWSRPQPAFSFVSTDRPPRPKKNKSAPEEEIGVPFPPM